MRKFLLLLCMVAIGSASISAREVTQTEAARIASSFGTTAQNNTAMVKGVAAPKLAYTEFADGQPLYYIFNRPGSGYIIVSADDKAASVLAYSDTQAFTSIDAVPENMRAWLTSYAMQVRQAIATPNARAPRREQRAAISPLLQTTWGQDAPFNAFCPLVNKSVPDDIPQTQSVVGCVGTAMAQVLKYYNYPAQAQGEVSYVWERRDGGETVTIKHSFEGHTYDWDNMINRYKDITSTQAQKDAVAQLAADCSYSVEMQFDESSSAAATMLVPYALTKYFGYDGAVKFEDRPFYSDEEWEDLIYSELAARRPVIYCGTTASNSSHTWIIDGIDEHGLFHINWGWEEFQDGFFALTGTDILNPEVGGTGGAKVRESFVFNQGCVIGIQPNAGGAPIIDFTSTLPEELDVTLLTRPIQFDLENAWLTLSGKFLNNSTRGVDVFCDFGIKLHNRQTNEEEVFQMPFANNEPIKVDAWLGLASISIPRTDLNFLPSGEYDVIPVYRDYSIADSGAEVILTPNGDWKEFRYYKDAAQKATLRLDGVVPDIYITQELTNIDPVLNNLQFQVTLHSNTNFFGYIVPMMFEYCTPEDQEAGWYAYNYRIEAQSVPLELAAGESRTITLGPWKYMADDNPTPMLLTKLFFAPLATTPWNEATALEPAIKNQAVFTAQLPSAISAVRQSNLIAPVEIFTIDGRRIGNADKRNSLKPGLYVIGGRKVMIK